MKKLLLSFIGLFLCVGLALAQDKTVTGKITDDAGSTQLGVSVQIENTTRGTTTTANGTYNIAVASGDVLVFSFVGFSPVEETGGSRSTINV